MVRVHVGEPFQTKVAGVHSCGLFCCALSDSKCNRVKWLPKLDGQLAVRPGRVRGYQIQQAPFLCDRTIFEAFAGLTRQLQQGNSFLHVRLIGEFVLINRLLEATLLGPVLLGLLVEEPDADTPVETVGSFSLASLSRCPLDVSEANTSPLELEWGHKNANIRGANVWFEPMYWLANT